MQREVVDKWLTRARARVPKVINHNPVCDGTSLLSPCVRVKVDGKDATFFTYILDPSVPVFLLGFEVDARGQCQQARCISSPGVRQRLTPD